MAINNSVDFRRMIKEGYNRKINLNKNRDGLDANMVKAIEKSKQDPKVQQRKADSEERREIAQIIIDMAKAGKSKLDVLLYLNTKFPDSPNNQFFMTWIEHHFNKLNIKGDFIEDIGEK